MKNGEGLEKRRVCGHSCGVCAGEMATPKNTAKKKNWPTSVGAKDRVCEAII